MRSALLARIFILVLATAPVSASSAADSTQGRKHSPGLKRRINFVAPQARKQTPNPLGWEAYDGGVYNRQRGYGWLAQLTGFWASDRGQDAPIETREGLKTSPRRLERLELANWQGTHRENEPIVFRIDLPDGWYRVHCASVGDGVLPVVDQRSFKCRAHDSVFAGAEYGPPLTVRGVDLVEGGNIVEVTDGHLRVVIGDPAYGGWAWSYKGPWYRGWHGWWGEWGNHRYAERWRQKMIRVIDPGFHSLRLNSLEVERVQAPQEDGKRFFRDYFNRDDSADINSGLPAWKHWIRLDSAAAVSERIGAALHKTALRMTGSEEAKAAVVIAQKSLSPGNGIIRYSTRVSLFTGAGSEVGSGAQEAGLWILADPSAPNDYNATFIGLGWDRRRPEAHGSLIYRVGDGKHGFRSRSEIPDSSLPFRVAAGEYEIIAEHNINSSRLERIRINGVDITGFFKPPDLRQRVARGLFGVRASMDPLQSRVSLRQYYWFYRVEVGT